VRFRPHLLAVLALCLPFGAPPAGALAQPGDPIVAAEDVLAPAGTFLSAVHRVSLEDGSATQLTAAGALGDAAGLAFTGPDTLVTVGFQSVARLDLPSGQLVDVVTPAAGVGDLRGVALAPDGSVVAVDVGPLGGPETDGRLLRIDPADGSFTVLASGGLLTNPLGVAIAEDGAIYVTDQGVRSGRVVKIDPANGAQSVLAGAPLVLPWGIAFLPGGDLVVADAAYNLAFRGALVRIDPITGEQNALFLEQLAGPIETATGVAVDAAGKVLVTERNSAQIDRVDLDTGVAQLVNQGVPGPLDLEPQPGVPPTTRLLSGPTGTTRTTTPTFTFEPSQYGAQSSCAIDAAAAVPCQRTFTSPPLETGRHSFRVSSTRLGAEGPAAVRSFTVDPSAPDTLITAGPAGLTNDAAPTFAFEAPGGGATFACNVDEAAASPCTSPFTVAAPLADGPHSFTVRADGDDVGDTRAFTVDTVAPETAITSGPAEGASTAATRPTFTFASSEGPSTFGCTLDGVAVPCTSVFTPELPLGEGAHTLTVEATDAAGNSDPTPVVRQFTVDVTAPVTTITSGPEGITDVAAPTFTFTASESVFFRCSVDSETLTNCASPFTVAPALADGAHRFRVQAIDSAGNTETPIQRDFTVATGVPETSITAGPAGLTSDASPSFAFESTRPGSTFACALDGGAASVCESPFQAAVLEEGAHTFSVTATDPLGIADPTPATRNFTVDTTPPETSIDAGPSGDTTDQRPTFSFSSNEAATFRCGFDGDAPVACDRVFQPGSALALGAHTFEVTAIDVLGRVDPSPARRSFRLVAAGGGKPEPPRPPVERISAGLELRASLRKGRLRLRATLSPGATGSVAVTVRGRHGQTGLARKLSLRIAAGQATGGLRVPGGISRVRLLATYAGDAGHLPGSATQTVRQTR
jgi:Bacterial Ig-like domain